MIKIIRYIFGLPKSIFVNFKLCNFKDAVKLPIIVSSRTKLGSLSGSVSFGKVRTGIVRVGFGSVETYDYTYKRTLLSIKGNVHFNGKTKIGFGSSLSVDGELVIGNNFHISAASSIICRKKIVIKDNCLMAWESLITDSDLHPIYNLDQARTNHDRDVLIGEHCWIGAKTAILKGARIAPNTVIALGAIVVNQFDEENTVIAGNPAKVIKQKVLWRE